MISYQQTVQTTSPPVWYETYEPPVYNREQSRANRKTVKRDNRMVEGLSLPIISVSNLRSLPPKLNSFKIDLLEREISLALLSEIWEKTTCKKQQFELEKMYEMEGLKYISTPRTQKRGGGAAIVVNTRTFTLEKIQVIIPYQLEVVWGLVRPKKMSSKVKEIIVGSFYSPPKSKKNSKLLDHLISTTHFLLTKYPNAGVVLGGDKNNLNISTLISGIPRMKQIVTQNTHKNKILDVIVTNMHALYGVPEIAPPVPPDDPACGVPSDHSTPIATPLALDSTRQVHEYVTRWSRPLPESGIQEFGQWVCGEDWESLPESLDPTAQVIKFEEIMSNKMDIIFPKKSVKLRKHYDKPFITAELKKLDRQVKREYKKHMKSHKYLRLKKSYDEKFKAAAESYLNKNVRSLMEDDPGKAYRSLKKMSSQPGDCEDETSFTLLSHIEDNLTTTQSIEKIADYFAQISQEYPPLNMNLLPDHVRAKVLTPANPDELPQLSDYDAYKKIRKTKKPRSQVPGDLPRRIVQEFSPELATPASIIFRNIIKSGHWPKSWKVEYGTPLQKENNPVTEEQLRIISLTNFLSKVMEQFVITWLMEYVGDKLDWGQYGGIKGSSISHYLIDFVNFILYNQDLKIPHAVIAVMIDFAKAFNRINHNIIITILSDMGVPGWLLNIVIGFLMERELVVRYKGRSSRRRSMPGGGPQGTRLGLFLFLILINAACSGLLEKHIGNHITQHMSKRKPLENIHLKYIDDLSMAQAINLKECLITNPEPNPPRPLSYHDRTNHLLPAQSYQLQEQLQQLVRYSQDNQMVINDNKCKVMLFNTSRKYDATPQLTLSDMGVGCLEVVETFRLLGVIVRSDLRWCDNTNYLCKKGYSRLWLLRRLKVLGANRSEMLDVYIKQVRSILELAVPVWHPGLSQQEVKNLERVQKCAFFIILGESYTSYEDAMKILGCNSLNARRYNLCQTFAKKAVKHSKYKHWFSEVIHESKYFSTRSSDKMNKPKFTPVPTRTDRYKKSPIPYLTELLNKK